YDSTSSWIPRQETARGSRNFFPALLAKRFAPLALGSRCMGRNGRPNTRHFFRRRRSSESHASLSEPEVQTESRNKEIRSRRTFYTGEQAMDNMAIPYSAAALPLSIHAVETEERLSRRLYFVCKRGMDVILAALLLALLLPLMLLV